MTRLNYTIIAFIIGLLLVFNAGFMGLSALVSLIYYEPEAINIGAASMVTAITGGIIMFPR